MKGRLKCLFTPDNAATTSVSKDALDAMLPYLTEQYGNPSSLYSFGQNAQEALQSARETIARCINADPREIYFTSGGSEADTRPSSPRPTWAPGRAKSTSSPPNSSTTPCCTPWTSWKRGL